MSGDIPVQTGANGAAPDFAVVTSVLPNGVDLIDHPKTLNAIVRVKDHPPLTINNQEQTIDINALQNPDFDSHNLPQDVSQFLTNASYLGLENTQIRLYARKIKNGRTNRLAIAVQTEEWVHKNMTANASIGLPRSAVEILSDRRGVCRDYALLYTALARSAGIPTKLCAGLVGYHGRFYYHAWAKSFIGGKIGWLTVDPTLDEVPIDASHIALDEGDPATMYDLVGKIGEIQVTILSCT
jgi:transglutaminase-like putative cysteine protease